MFYFVENDHNRIQLCVVCVYIYACVCVCTYVYVCMCVCGHVLTLLTSVAMSVSAFAMFIVFLYAFNCGWIRKYSNIIVLISD